MNIHHSENGAVPSNRTRLTTDRKDIEVSSRILVGSIFTCNRGFSMPKPRDGYLSKVPLVFDRFRLPA